MSQTKNRKIVYFLLTPLCVSPIGLLILHSPSCLLCCVPNRERSGVRDQRRCMLTESDAPLQQTTPQKASSWFGSLFSKSPAAAPASVTTAAPESTASSDNKSSSSSLYPKITAPTSTTKPVAMNGEAYVDPSTEGTVSACISYSLCSLSLVVELNVKFGDFFFAPFVQLL